MNEILQLLKQAKEHLSMQMALSAYRECLRALALIEELIPEATGDDWSALWQLAGEVHIVAFDAARALVRQDAAWRRKEAAVGRRA